MGIKVNGVKITDEDMRAYLIIMEELQIIPNASEKFNDMGTELFINRELLLQHALKYTSKLSETEIDSLTKQVIAELKNIEAIQTLLKSKVITKKHLTVLLKAESRISNMHTMLRDEIEEPDTSHLKEYYLKNKKNLLSEWQVAASSIVIKAGNDTDRYMARKTLLDALNDIKRGDSFFDLRDDICGEFLGEEDVMMGIYYQGNMPENWEKEVCKLKDGELSGLIETDDFICIVKMIENLPAKVMDFEEDQDDILDTWIDEQYQLKLDKLLEELRAAATIEYF